MSVMPIDNGPKINDLGDDAIDGEDEILDDTDYRRIDDPAESGAAKPTSKRPGCYRYSRCLCVPGVVNKLLPCCLETRYVTTSACDIVPPSTLHFPAIFSC